MPSYSGVILVKKLQKVLKNNAPYEFKKNHQSWASFQSRMKCNGENSVVGLTGLALEGVAAQYGTLLSLAHSTMLMQLSHLPKPGWNI